MKKRRNRRDDIVRAAIDVVAENGLSTVSTRLIAAQAGVSSSLMYRFFKSKDELLVACLHQVLNSLTRSLEGYTEIQADSMEEYVKEIHRRWNLFFAYLVEHAFDTLFFYYFSNSIEVVHLTDSGEFHAGDFYAMLSLKLGASVRDFANLKNGAVPYFWIYYLHLSLFFAVETIQGKLPGTEQIREGIWRFFPAGFRVKFPILLPQMQGADARVSLHKQALRTRYSHRWESPVHRARFMKKLRHKGQPRE